MVVHRHEHIFSIISMNLSAWCNVLGLGSNSVSAESPKSEYGSILIFVSLVTIQGDRQNLLNQSGNRHSLKLISS
jgi:hypothetical protein